MTTLLFVTNKLAEVIKMQILQEQNYKIFYESSKQMMVCYKDNAFHKLMSYKKPVFSIYQLHDDARDWYEQWIAPRLSIRD